MSETPEKNIAALLGAGVDFEKRTLYVMGEIDAKMAYRFIVGLRKLDETDGDIIVIFNSPGGEESSGYAMYDAITMTHNTVIAEGYGLVASISAAIFQAADIRRMSPHTQFMIHNGTIPTGEDVQQNIIVDLADQIRKNNIRYHTILANRSKMSYSDIEDACRGDSFFSADECLKKGFCDEVLEPFKKFSKRKSHKRKKQT